MDVATRGFWVKGQMAFFEPTAKTYLVQNLNNAHKRNEQEKKRNYNQRILTVDQGSFTPLVFSCLEVWEEKLESFINVLQKISQQNETYQLQQ